MVFSLYINKYLYRFCINLNPEIIIGSVIHWPNIQWNYNSLDYRHILLDYRHIWFLIQFLVGNAKETGNGGRQIGQKGVSATGNFPNSRDSIKPPLLMETARVTLPKKLNSPDSEQCTRTDFCSLSSSISAICQIVFLLSNQISWMPCIFHYWVWVFVLSLSASMYIAHCQCLGLGKF